MKTKTKRYEGTIGDAVAVGYYHGSTLSSMARGVVSNEVGGGTPRVGVLINETVRWFLRDGGAQVKANGHEYAGPGTRVLLGPWLGAYGENGNLLSTPEACAAAMRRADGDGVVDPRQRAIASSVAEICALFGVDQNTLRERAAAEHGAAADMAHNVFRKFAVGAIVHLAYEVDIAWAGRNGGVARQGLRAVAEVPQLAGIHRGTLGSFRDQFAALAGLGTDARGRAIEPRAGIGRFVRDRYAEIRRATVAAAAGDAPATGDGA